MSKSSRRDSRPATAPIAGRTARPRRSAPRASFLERYRSILIGLVIVVAVGGIAAIGLLGATGPAWACSTEWTAPETPQPAPGATPRIGYVQQDQGRTHIGVGEVQRYASCPPASGKHINAAGQGPIPPRVYGPEDDARPQGWIHNLEHGGMVILYRCPSGACEDAGQEELRELFATFPASPICGTARGIVGPVIARFDEMATPYAAVLWNLILPLETLDRAQIEAFWAQQGERTHPELAPGCVRPTPTPAPTATPSPSTSATDTPSPTVDPSASPSPG